MIKIWSDLAWNDYCVFFEKHQKKQIQMIHELLKDIERNGADKGRGQPEQLKHDLSEYYSRRIDKMNRLVYKIDDDNKLFIAQCGSHYQD